MSQRAVSDWPIASPIPTPANWWSATKVVSTGARAAASEPAAQAAASPGTA